MEQCQDPALPQLRLLSSLLPLQRLHRLENGLHMLNAHQARLTCFATAFP